MKLETAQLLAMYERMALIRNFENKLAELFSSGSLGGTSHFCVGEEASAVGVIWAADEKDWLISNHRGHGHLLARGLEPRRVMAELMGKDAGYCRGRGGSQHISCMEKHFLGTNGITGGGIPIAAGAALSAKYKKTGEIAICFFGDGASNQGTFHETLNMASLWQLPILFVCENNGYAMSTPLARNSASGNISPRAAAYNMKASVCNGFDVEETYFTAKKIITELRESSVPQMLEVMTYRHCGHSKNDSRVYRTREEEQEMMAKDCIAAARAKLLERGITEAEIITADNRAHTTIENASQFAIEAPVSSPESALEGLFA